MCQRGWGEVHWYLYFQLLDLTEFRPSNVYVCVCVCCWPYSKPHESRDEISFCSTLPYLGRWLELWYVTTNDILPITTKHVLLPVHIPQPTCNSFGISFDQNRLQINILLIVWTNRTAKQKQLQMI